MEKRGRSGTGKRKEYQRKESVNATLIYKPYVDNRVSPQVFFALSRKS